MAKPSRSKTRVEASLAASNSPIFAIDARRRLVFFNAGCEQLTGWLAAEVIGTVCVYAGQTDHSRKESIGGSLGPPPEVFEGGAQVVPATVLCRDGEAVARLIHYFPLMDSAGIVDRVLGVMTPIEKRAKRVESTAAQQLHAELAALRVSLRQRFGLESLVCRSEAMLRVAEQIRVARGSNAAVHLRGEKGTGKEHVARAIHAGGPAAGQAFVPLDCGRLPTFDLKQTLKRLFPQGAGAPAGDEPAVSWLQPGSVYLMNVETLPRDLQEFLVEAYRSSAPWRDGKRRLMSSTCIDMGAAVADDSIRSDFYYLLTTVEIEIPPLRRREEDLAPLAQSILEDLNRHEERQVGGFADEVWTQFREYNWPGNVDELATVIAEARAATRSGLIAAADLPFRFRAGRDAQAVGPPPKVAVEPLEQLLQRVEVEEIRRALDAARNNRSKAAELLGITRPRLYRRMQVLGIDRAEGDRGASDES